MTELRRRRVFRSLLAWGVISFAVLQVVEPVQHALHLPDGILSAVVGVLGLGFPVVAALAWVFDVGPGGITRTATQPGASLSGGRAALLLVALGLLAAAPGIVYHFVWPGAARRAASPGRRGEAPASSSERGEVPSIAVLPFADMSAARDQEFMGDGLAEEILNLLAQVEGLQVAGRTSSFSFKGKSARLDEIGRELHVANVLEGSVRRAGQRIRVTAQLVKASDGFHLWSQDFDRDLSDVLALQDEIARSVVGAIAPRLTGRAHTGSERGPAPSPEAYAAYLEGKQGVGPLDLARLRRGEASLERAVELAPRFAPAHAVLARAYGLHAGYFVDTPMDVTRYASLERAAADRAVALDPELGEAYAARASNALQYGWEWARALEDAQRAVALSPGSADSRRVHAAALLALGRSNEGLAELRRALAADPLNEADWHNLGGSSLNAGDLAGAREALAQLERLAPSSNRSRWLRAALRLEEGRYADALADFRALTLDLDFARLTGVAICEHRLGHQAESRAAVDELATRLGGSAAWQVVQARAQRGEADLAFEWLERARAQHDAGVTGVLDDRYLAPLRGDPRWKPFLRKMGLPD